jgi:hypothetical protein
MFARFNMSGMTCRSGSWKTKDVFRAGRLIARGNSADTMASPLADAGGEAHNRTVRSPTPRADGPAANGSQSDPGATKGG